MPEWIDGLHDAPRDGTKVCLFLPGRHWKVNEHHQPFGVEHGECIGYWDRERSAWIDSATNHPVYPSRWRRLEN